MVDFSKLKAGDIIHSSIDGDMKVVLFDYYGDGEEICLEDEFDIYPTSQFYPEDWELKEVKKIDFVYATGGREKYFKQPNVRDCVSRAICNATNLDYKQVYDDLNELEKTMKVGKREKQGSSRSGIRKRVEKHYISDVLGWKWHPTMQIGSGCKVHLRANELPSGTLIVNVSGHLTCVKNGVLYDTYDCSRDGTRCVYGYWTKE